MKRKIIKRSIDALRKGEIVWDTALSGFGARRHASGAVTFLIKYRAGRRQRWLKLGTFGRMTPAEARTAARIALGAVEKGQDPAQERDEARKVGTVADLCDRFTEVYIKPRLAAKPPKMKQSTADAYERIIRNHIKPSIGKIAVRAVTQADVIKMQYEITTGKHARDEKVGKRARIIVRGGAGASNRAVTLLSLMFRHAERWGWRPRGSNPCLDVEKYREQGRERFLSPAELQHLGTAIRDLEASNDIGPYAAAAARFLILTGMRRGEALSLEWSHVDFEGAVVNLPDSKTGKKAVVLNPPALDLLARLPRVNGNPHVFVGAKEGLPIADLKGAWRAIRSRATVLAWAADKDEAVAGLVAKLRKKRDNEPTEDEIREAAAKASVALPKGLSDVRLHDLRHSFASIGVATGLGLPIIGALLGHRRSETTHRYAHAAEDPVRAASEAIGKRIAAAMAGGSADVVGLTLRRGHRSRYERPPKATGFPRSSKS